MATKGRINSPYTYSDFINETPSDEHVILLGYISRGAFKQYITAIENDPTLLAGLVTDIVKKIGTPGFTAARANKAIFTIRAKPSLRNRFDIDDLDVAKQRLGQFFEINNVYNIDATIPAAIKERRE